MAMWLKDCGVEGLRGGRLCCEGLCGGRAARLKGCAVRACVVEWLRTVRLKEYVVEGLFG